MSAPAAVGVVVESKIEVGSEAILSLVIETKLVQNVNRMSER